MEAKATTFFNIDAVESMVLIDYHYNVDLCVGMISLINKTQFEFKLNKSEEKNENLVCDLSNVGYIFYRTYFIILNR